MAQKVLQITAGDQMSHVAVEDMSLQLKDAGENIVTPAGNLQLRITSPQAATAASAVTQSGDLTVTCHQQRLKVEPFRLVCTEPGNIVSLSH